jgi:RNA polymerase sigma-70 factor (ECF subfamily)
MEASAQPLDLDTIGRLFEQHGDRVYGYCLRVLGCEHDAADATQDAFMNLPRRGDASLEALRDAGADLDRAPLEPRSEPEQRALDNAARAAVFGALATVPERQRTAFVLRELGGLTYDELAEQLGMNANSVAQLLHRARRALQVALPIAAYN